MEREVIEDAPNFGRTATRLLQEMPQVAGASHAARPDSTAELFVLLYDELYRLAVAYMARERAGHTLQPTAIVHEAYMQVARAGAAPLQWKNRSHFLGVAAIAMRRVLVHHARSRGAIKRGGADAASPEPGGWKRVTLDQVVAPPGANTLDVLELDQALEKLARLEPRAARVVELRFYGGLTIPECAEVLAVSTGTIDADWSFARAWMRRELSEG